MSSKLQMQMYPPPVEASSGPEWYYRGQLDILKNVIEKAVDIQM